MATRIVPSTASAAIAHMGKEFVGTLCLSRPRPLLQKRRLSGATRIEICCCGSALQGANDAPVTAKAAPEETQGFVGATRVAISSARPMKIATDSRHPVARPSGRLRRWRAQSCAHQGVAPTVGSYQAPRTRRYLPSPTDPAPHASTDALPRSRSHKMRFEGTYFAILPEGASGTNAWKRQFATSAT